MAFALLQKTLEPPSVDQLKTAFHDVPGLTPYDAFTLGKDAFGILLRKLDLRSANILKLNLAEQGIDTDLVDEDDLPALPEARNIPRLDCAPEGLTLYDPLNRPFALGWDKVQLIAAGCVNIDEFNQVRTVTEVPDYSRSSPSDVLLSGVLGLPRIGPPKTTTVVKYDTKEQRVDHWLFELVVTGGKIRYCLVADKAGGLLFQSLGDRRTDNFGSNFALLVQDIIKFAPQAAINRGTYYIRENHPTAFRYPTKIAFQQEMIWLLWQMANK